MKRFLFVLAFSFFSSQVWAMDCAAWIQAFQPLVALVQEGVRAEAALSSSPIIPESTSSDSSQLSDSDLIELMGQPSIEGWTVAVLFAEKARFPPEQAVTLTEPLFLYANTHCNTSNEEQRAAVGAAIRKFAMNMHESQFERYGQLFEQMRNANCEAHYGVQSVLAQYLVNRLTDRPIDTEVPTPTLNQQLVDLALASWERGEEVFPRPLKLEDKTPSFVSGAAVGATTAAILLGAKGLDEVLAKARSSQATWVKEMLADEIERSLSATGSQPVLQQRLTEAKSILGISSTP
jgi:hypothetical protein